MVDNVLVTGANGFIGNALCRRLNDEGWSVIAVVRNPGAVDTDHRLKPVRIGSIDDATDWKHILAGVDIVVHLAARVHVLCDSDDDPIDAYRRVNVKGTVNLAQAASEAGVKRFVFLSSVKVHGEESQEAYNEKLPLQPQDPYGISKMEAEIELDSICNTGGMEKVVIRPPLVYGAGVKANFRALMNMVHRRIPLPLAKVHNQRSFIYIGNLIDSITACMTHLSAAGNTYLVSDNRDVSTPELIRMIADSLDIPNRMFSFPPSVLRSIANILRKGDAVKRLLGSLSVDITKIKTDLCWQPPFSMESGLMYTAKWYKQR